MAGGCFYWKVIGIQVFAVFKELEPSLFLGFDLLGGEFVQFKEVDAAMVEQAAVALVAQPVAVRVAGVAAQEVFAQEPDAVGGLQRVIILTAL